MPRKDDNLHPLVDILSDCLLFKNIKKDCILKILNNTNYTVKSYTKDETIAIEQDECNHLGIVLEGLLAVQTIFPSGKVVTLTQLAPTDIFGEVMLFAPIHQYPATITALKPTKTMFIHRKVFIALMSEHPCIMENFISSLSNKLLLLNNKVKILSLESIRQKICSYLLQIYTQQKSDTLKVPLSRKDMAEFLGIPRPSLSRELIKMRDENILDFKKDFFILKDIDALEDCSL